MTSLGSRITVNEVRWRNEFSIFFAVCVCLSVGQTPNLLHPTWVVKGIPQAPLVSNNNFCRVTRTAEVKGLTDTRSDQHFFTALAPVDTSDKETFIGWTWVRVPHLFRFVLSLLVGSSGPLRTSPLSQVLTYRVTLWPLKAIIIPPPTTPLNCFCTTERVKIVGAITTTHGVMVFLFDQKLCAVYIYFILILH